MNRNLLIMKSTQLVPIEKTFERQFLSMKKEVHFKIMGIGIFILCLFLPWRFSGMYWGHIERLIVNQSRDGFIITFCWSTLIMTTLYSFYGFLYYLNNKNIEKFKDNEVPWPWNTDDNWKPKIKKALLVNIFNHVILAGALGYLGTKAEVAKFKTKLEEMPSFPVFVCQVLFLIVVEDFTFYCSHRFLHQPWIYKYVHKQHHEFYNSIVITSEYAHPFEYILGNFLPSTLGSILMMGRTHLLSMIIFITLRLIETCEAHSGYDFPFSLTKYLPLSCSPSYHNHHHLTNIGNYGSFFMVWDSVFGTNSYYYQTLDENNSKKVE